MAYKVAIIIKPPLMRVALCSASTTFDRREKLSTQQYHFSNTQLVAVFFIFANKITKYQLPGIYAH